MDLLDTAFQSLFGLPWIVFSVIGQIIGLLHVPSVLLRRSNRISAQIAWILCLLTLPYVGVFLWWVIGRTHLRRRRRKRARAMAQISRSMSDLSDRLDLPAVAPAAESPMNIEQNRALLLEDNDLFPSTEGNLVQLLVRGGEAFPAMLDAIARAQHHIHLEFYIWQRDRTGERIRDALVERAKEGVEVRVLYDAVGASPVKGRFMEPLREAGGQVVPFLPVRLLERRLRVNFRNHRKIVVVDGQVGFTGGINIGDEYNDWFDLLFRFEGPVVNQLQEVFAEDWFFAADEDLADPDYFGRWDVVGPTASGEDGELEGVLARVVTSGPDNPRNTIHMIFFIAITTARERVWITTPYFVPDPSTIMALRAAALRGVDVRLVLPGISDVPFARIAGRGYYEELLEVGVRIFEYQPEILHAKFLLFDHRWTLVGSANMDTRSFLLNFEANCAMEGEAVNHALEQVFLQLVGHSREIDYATFCQRPQLQRLTESSARLFSPLL